MLFAMRAKVNRISWTLGILILAGCTHPGRGVKSCKYRFQNFSFLSMDAAQTHWQVDVAVTNPNDHEVTLTRMRYALLHESDTLLSGWNPEKRVVRANDSMSMRTTIDLPNSVLKRLPPGIWSQKDAKFTFVADAYLNTWMGDIVVPQAIKETVKIDMTQQVAKYRDMLMQKFFSWPGRRLEDGEIPAPNPNPPSEGAPAPGYETAPNEHL